METIDDLGSLNSPQEIRVSAPRQFAYSVVIGTGLAAHLPRYLAQLNASSLVLITDNTVCDLFTRALADTCKTYLDCEVHLSVLDSGEMQKSLRTADLVYEFLLESGTRRRSVLVAVGGGTTIDLVGFVASTFMRGIGYVNVPTTLVAQTDASIGGKTAVNHERAKNLIGSFWPPIGVYVDPLLLTTLPSWEMRNGLSEVMKLAIVASPSLFEFVEMHYQEILSFQTDSLEWLVTEAIREKVRVLLEDPYEQKLARSLNFGHTLGHPLETIFGYVGLTHGQAVAIGMYLATQISHKRQICLADTAKRVLALLERVCLPNDIPDIQALELWENLGFIRLIRDGKLHFVLPKQIGQVVYVDDVTMQEIDDALSCLKNIGRRQSNTSFYS